MKPAFVADQRTGCFASATGAAAVCVRGRPGVLVAFCFVVGLGLGPVLGVVSCGVAPPEAGADDAGTSGELDAGLPVDVDDTDGGTSGDEDAGTPADAGAGGVDAGVIVDCAARLAADTGIAVCAEDAAGCSLVFTDGRGCEAACAAAGLGCAEVRENLSSGCGPDLARPALGCTPASGHDSDFCVCRPQGPCVASCTGRVCGDDGCGGSCGDCDADERCRSGTCVAGVAPSCTADDCPAFPGAEGFGSRARGGRAGDVYRVTSLADSGDGSLRQGIASATGPRTIVFAVGGTIQLSSTLVIDHDHLTIAGETAPGDGILIRGATTQITADDVILRHLRFRRGGSDDTDALWIRGAADVIIDHVSASWGRDETLSITRAFNRVTVQDCIIAEDTREDHQYGSLLSCETDGGQASLLRNAYINEAGRTPRAASQDDKDFLLQMVNNVIYNWGTVGDFGTWANGGTDQRARWNMVGNFHIAGQNSKKAFVIPFVDPIHEERVLNCNGEGASIYFDGNLIDSNRDGVLDRTAAQWDVHVDRDCARVDAPHAEPVWAAVRALPASEALQAAIENAGALPWARDAVDRRLMDELQSWGTEGAVRTSVPGWPAIAGGPAPLDTDEDGMPDDWERRLGLDPADPQDRNGDIDNDGYTNLEGYLHYCATPPADRPF
jgi:hypothetical protein